MKDLIDNIFKNEKLTAYQKYEKTVILSKQIIINNDLITDSDFSILVEYFSKKISELRYLLASNKATDRGELDEKLVGILSELNKQKEKKKYKKIPF